MQIPLCVGLLRSVALLLFTTAVVEVRGQVEQFTDDPDQDIWIEAMHVLVPYQDSSTKFFGYASRDGRSIKARFEHAGYFREGFAVVRSKGAWGAIDTTGNFVLEPKYVHLMPPVDGSTVAFLPGNMDPCLIEIGRRVKCIPYPEYWTAWKEHLRASTVPDKELIIRVLDMHKDPLSRQQEISNLEYTYVLMIDVRATTTRELFGN